jgi:hypothetical protein
MRLQDVKKEKKLMWQPVGYDRGILSSQYFAYNVAADEILLHGTRGYGKTITQLMRFRKNVGVGYGNFWKGVIFDVEFSSFSDIISQSKRFFPYIGQRPRFLESTHLLKWIWPSGEELHFVYAKDEKDYERKMHGKEYCFIGYNEITKHYTDDLYKLSFSIRRSSFTPELDTPIKEDRKGNELLDQYGNVVYSTPNGKILPDIPLETLSTCNPWGSGAIWVQRRFIDGSEDGIVYRDTVEADGEKVELSRVSIGGTWKENLRKNGGFLDIKYVARMKEECKGNKARYKAWIEGKWGYSGGGMFSAVWDKDVHCLTPFRIPPSWYVDRGFDWGSTHPFYVGWFARADGTEAVLPNGKIFCPVKGSIILISEWYGTGAIGTNKSVKNRFGDSLNPTEIAQGIKEREILIRKRLLHPTMRINPGPADTQIWDDTRSDVPSIAETMAKEKVSWTRANKAPNTRKLGWSLLRQALYNAHPTEKGLVCEKPAFYVFSDCKGMISTLPLLEMDKIKIDDVDTNGEDHPADVARYKWLDVVRETKASRVRGYY